MFGTTLKRLRMEKGIKQEEFAQMFGVVPSTVSSWENNISEPGYETTKKIARYFNVSIDFLLGFNQEEQQKVELLKRTLKENGFSVNDDFSIEDLEKAFQIIDIFDKK